MGHPTPGCHCAALAALVALAALAAQAAAAPVQGGRELSRVPSDLGPRFHQKNGQKVFIKCVLTLKMVKMIVKRSFHISKPTISST